MTQAISDKFWQAEARTEETKRFIRDIKRITRRKSTAEEKIRIVLEGFRRYHQGLGNVTPYDVYTGRHLEVIHRRRRRKTGHYKQEGTIIEPPGSRAVASKVSVNSEGRTVPLSLTTYTEKRRRENMTRALFVLTPAESKRLIGKAVAQMEEVKYAFQKSNILIGHGVTNICVLEELLGKDRLYELMDPSTYVTGIIKRGILCATAAKKKTPIVLLKRGIVTPPAATMSEMLSDFDSHSVVIKGANAIDAEGNAGVLAAHPEGGTVGWAIGSIVARGIRLITPVGLEKLIPSVRHAVSLCGQDTFDYVQGLRVGMIPLINAKVVTEIEAIKILTGVDAFHVASGGINGSEGSVALATEGGQEAMNRTIELIESIKGEVPLNFPEAVCETCGEGSQLPSKRPDSLGPKVGCQFRDKKDEELPPYLRRR